MNFKNILAFIIAVFAVFSLASCGKEKEKEEFLELIDFENSVLNINNSEIEKYVKSNGYEKVDFVFDVDKQIYSCEITLPEKDNKKIEIDGEGYESFIAETRTFLINGTKVMKSVLEGYGLSGISSGMVLISNEDVVYCVAVDGSVTYVAHTQKETTSVDDIKAVIKEKAEAILKTNVDVNFNALELTISISYKGKQTKESVNTCFEEIKAYLKEAGLGNYVLGVGGADGQPLVYDEAKPVEESLPQVPETVHYNQVGYIGAGNSPLFEIVSNENEHETVGGLAVDTLKKEFPSSSFFVYVVNQDEKFLGKGSKNGYTPYVFSTKDSESDTSSCEIPFVYYFSKYFNEIEYTEYSYQSYLNSEHGYKQCVFTISFASTDDHEKVSEAAQKLINALEATIDGKPATITIIAYPNTEHEIKVRTYDPAFDGEI